MFSVLLHYVLYLNDYSIQCNSNFQGVVREMRFPEGWFSALLSRWFVWLFFNVQCSSFVNSSRLHSSASMWASFIHVYIPLVLICILSIIRSGCLFTFHLDISLAVLYFDFYDVEFHYFCPISPQSRFLFLPFHKVNILCSASFLSHELRIIFPLAMCIASLGFRSCEVLIQGRMGLWNPRPLNWVCSWWGLLCVLPPTIVSLLDSVSRANTI